MSNTQKFGKSSMRVVHRVLKRGKKAQRYSVGSINRRLVMLEKVERPSAFMGIHLVGSDSYWTPRLTTRERQYHFTKGYRTRAA